MKPVMQSVDLTPNRPLVPLPDGSRRIALGSGEITRCIGHGGMAAVYEIWNSQLEMYRAVKIINPGSAEIVHERFQTEIKISAKLKHPNIVEIYAVGEWNKLPYIEMEKIDGIGLDAVIANHGALPAAICTAVGIQICRALNYAHNQDCTIYGKSYHGVIHRDLKPANIMIGEKGSVKLMDFGIARPADVSFHTMDGLVAGTLQYLAPEQIERKKLDMRTDLYALGLVMYEIVTGAITFPQTSFANLVTCKTKNKFTPIEAFRVAIPQRLKRIIYKCMQFESRNRVADAAHLLKDLESIHRTITHATPEEILAWMMADRNAKKVVLVARKRFPWKTACLVLLAAAGVAAGLHFGVLKKVHFQTSNAAIPAPLAPDSNPAAKSLVSAIVASPVPNGSAPSGVFKKGQSGKRSAAPPSKESEKPKDAVVALTGQKPGLTSRGPATVADSMKNLYGAADLLDIIEKESAKKNWPIVLSLFDALSPDQARSDQAIVFKIRALDGAGMGAGLDEFLRQTTLNDGEIYLAKAKVCLHKGDYSGCRKCLDKSLNTAHPFIEYSVLKREVLYYTALCSTAQFDANPSESAYKEALDAWWQLRSVLHSEPGHEYNKKAAEELQRIGKKMQKG
jgi:serine/threonine protein kinase